MQIEKKNSLNIPFQCPIITDDKDENCVWLNDLASRDAENVHWPELNIDPSNDVAVIFFSSGASGLPKPVMLSHRNLVASILCMNSRVTPIERLNVSPFPLYHAAGLVSSCRLRLALGITIVLYAHFDLEQYLKGLQTYKVRQAKWLDFTFLLIRIA